MELNLQDSVVYILQSTYTHIYIIYTYHICFAEIFHWKIHQVWGQILADAKICQGKTDGHLQFLGVKKESDARFLKNARLKEIGLKSVVFGLTKHGPPPAKKKMGFVILPPTAAVFLQMHLYLFSSRVSVSIMFSLSTPT